MAAEISRNAVAANLNPNNNQNAEQGNIGIVKSLYTLPSISTACPTMNDIIDIRPTASTSQNGTAKKMSSNFSNLTKTLLPLTSTTRYANLL